MRINGYKLIDAALCFTVGMAFGVVAMALVVSCQGVV